MMARHLNLFIRDECTMILANAVVDLVSEGPNLSTFKVEVWGSEPHDYVRTYEILAKDEDSAAREGLDTFVSEITDLISQETFQ
jgi:hypothetical protein